MMSFAEKLKALFGRHSAVSEDFFDDLTDTLIEGDIGAKMAVELVDALHVRCRKEKITESQAITAALSSMMQEYVEVLPLEPEAGKVNLYLLLGVNGVGKTTTVAKLARWYGQRKIPVVMAAADTFRAAAIDQLDAHGTRLGMRVVKHQMGSDPASVVFDAAAACAAQGGGLVLADTAGRLHNKEHLVNELKKIDRIASSKADAGCYKKLLVLDATTGQNAVRQAEVFHEAVGVDALVLTKYDSTAKGGEVVTIGKELHIPVAFVCTGEHYEDISIMDRERYMADFFGH